LVYLFCHAAASFPYKKGRAHTGRRLIVGTNEKTEEVTRRLYYILDNKKPVFFSPFSPKIIIK